MARRNIAGRPRGTKSGGATGSGLDRKARASVRGGRPSSPGSSTGAGVTAGGNEMGGSVDAGADRGGTGDMVGWGRGESGLAGSLSCEGEAATGKSDKLLPRGRVVGFVRAFASSPPFELARPVSSVTDTRCDLRGRSDELDLAKTADLRLGDAGGLPGGVACILSSPAWNALCVCDGDEAENDR